MGNAISAILPQAIGVAISPVPIIAVILMLFSQRARSNGSAFLLGWVLALIVVGSIVLLLANLGKIAAEGTPSTLAYVLKLLLGLLFLLLAIRQWRGRPKAGEEPQMPKWMATIDTFTAGKAFGLAALLAGVNPKNLALTLAAPVLYYLFAGQSAEKMLTGWKAWLVANNATVMFVLFLVLGAQLFGQGLGGLIG